MTPAIPPQYDQVSVLTKANVYFDGNVVSHTVLFASGEKKTLGLIYPGAYNFGTGAPERMDIVSGACRVRLAGEEAWTAYAAGSFFQVPGNSSFDIAVEDGIAEYICSYE
ncbi:MAG TPA: pyrimidine/purine nucleoside phosphorylase [Armatimonadota bacterium]|jgi:hypothetical protein